MEKNKTGKLSAQINKENVHNISDEREQKGDDIQINDDDNKDTVIYDEEKSLFDSEVEKKR